MTKTLALTFLLLFTLAAVTLAADKTAEKTDEPVVLTGEIVDMHCYTSRGAHGPDHAGCSNACINRDVPVGLLTADGMLYLLLNEKPVAVKEKVAGMAGKTVKATGKVIERNGVKAFQLVSVAE
jgi:hypothetical protein